MNDPGSTTMLRSSPLTRSTLHIIALYFLAYLSEARALSTSGVLMTSNYAFGFGSSKASIVTCATTTVGQCAALCQDTAGCSGVNIRDDGDGGVSCELKAGAHSASDIMVMGDTRFYEVAVPGKNSRDCQELQDNAGVVSSGVYAINLDLSGSGPEYHDVYCDMSDPGIGWTVMIRRQDGSVDFEQNWQPYKDGFGDLQGEFWAGNELMYRMTSTMGKLYRVRVDLITYTGEHRYAEYDMFTVDSEIDNYRLHLGSYSGDATDSFSYHDNVPFSTPDRDNDNAATYGCGERYHSGWWYDACSKARLTGLYGEDVPDITIGPLIYKQGVVWYDWLGWDVHLEFAEMKIRPI